MLHAKFGANWSNHQGVVQKSMFFVVCNFVNRKIQQKWACPTPNNSAAFREHKGMIINNMHHIKWYYERKSLLH